MATAIDDKPFPTDLVATLALGYAIGGPWKMSHLHEIIEHVLGHPVLSHELSEAMKAARLKVAPLFDGFPTDEKVRLLDREARIAAANIAGEMIRKSKGEVMVLPKGTDQRTETPQASVARLFPNAEVVELPVPPRFRQ